MLIVKTLREAIGALSDLSFNNNNLRVATKQADSGEWCFGIAPEEKIETLQQEGFELLPENWTIVLCLMGGCLAAMSVHETREQFGVLNSDIIGYAE